MINKKKIEAAAKEILERDEFISNGSQNRLSKLLGIPGWWDEPSGIHVATAPDHIDAIAIADEFGYLFFLYYNGSVSEVEDEVVDDYRDLVPVVEQYTGTRLYGLLRRKGMTRFLMDKKWMVDPAVTWLAAPFPNGVP